MHTTAPADAGATSPATPAATSGSIPLACVPSAIPAGERPAHFALVRALFGPGRARHGIPDGYGFGFDADELPRVAQFVANERRCCPFLSFTIVVRAAADPARQQLALHITGPAGTRSFLDAEILS